MASGYTLTMPVLVAVRDLLLRSRIAETAERVGVPVRIARRGVPLSESIRELGRGAAIVDLAEPGVLAELERAKDTEQVRVIGFLGHLQTELAEAALEAGADQVLSRGKLVAKLDTLLRTAAGLESDGGALTPPPEQP